MSVMRQHNCKNEITPVTEKKERQCLSCGLNLSGRKRRYCSIDCRQRLRWKLDVRTGLLRALNTRYATFYFTPSMIILDILPVNSHEIFSYIFPRSAGNKPADDFSKMADVLGNAWWYERNRTNKRYLATRFVFEKAVRKKGSVHCVKPYETCFPAKIGKSLVYLKLSRDSLTSPELLKTIKSAYRKNAKRHHPDLGGDPGTFRRIYQAYEQLLEWVENPSFTRRRGFPDKWFYDGQTNRWVQPTPPDKKPEK